MPDNTQLQKELESYSDYELFKYLTEFESQMTSERLIILEQVILNRQVILDSSETYTLESLGLFSKYKEIVESYKNKIEIESRPEYINWNKIIDVVEWFGEMGERRRVVKSFNDASKRSFVSGNAPTLLKAKITMGESEYAHAFSKFLTSGFRIKALAGRQLNTYDIAEIGNVIMANKEIVRQLISLGWDTLYLYSNNETNGLKWSLKGVRQNDWR